MEYDNLLNLVKNRRSIRRFKRTPVPDEYIDKIIEVARWAPSGFNQQPWDFLVVKKADLKNKIAEFCRESRIFGPRMEAVREPWQGTAKVMPHPGEPDFSVAPVFILLLVDNRTREGLPMGVRYNLYRQQTIFVSGLASAFLYMHLAATSLGLASQWVSSVGYPYSQCMTKNLLGIRKEMEIYDMMALGYAALKPRTKLLRDKKKMVHYDKCSAADFRTDKEVRDFIRRARTWNIAAENRKGDK
ncbi:nitroreductase family protein [Chloroflexota bacterium]